VFVLQNRGIQKPGKPGRVFFAQLTAANSITRDAERKKLVRSMGLNRRAPPTNVRTMFLLVSTSEKPVDPLQR
jgi:hypothetical protein